MLQKEEMIEKIRKIIPGERVLLDEPMSAHTSFRIGGPADAFVDVCNERELAELLRLMHDENIEHIVIGNGSNFLVGDTGYRGVMIHLSGEFDNIRRSESDNTLVTVGSAKLLSGVSAFLTERGLAGFEFASGIPGSIGGAMFMNAGAYGGEMKDIVQSVRLVKADGSGIFEISNEEMQFGYRHSILQEDGCIVISATFRLRKDEPEAIRERVMELQHKRNEKQPVNFPSAGSTFKRPADGYAAALIDDAGLRGYTVGGAQVSEKHAGFVINIGNATAEDVLDVMRHVRAVVMRHTNILLEPEVRLIGCEL